MLLSCKETRSTLKAERVSLCMLTTIRLIVLKKEDTRGEGDGVGQFQQPSSGSLRVQGRLAALRVRYPILPGPIVPESGGEPLRRAPGQFPRRVPPHRPAQSPCCLTLRQSRPIRRSLPLPHEK